MCMSRKWSIQSGGTPPAHVAPCTGANLRAYLSYRSNLRYLLYTEGGISWNGQKLHEESFVPLERSMFPEETVKIENEFVDGFSHMHMADCSVNGVRI